MPKTGTILLICLITGLMSCKLTKEENTGSVAAKDFQLSDTDVSGWTQQSGGYNTYVDQTSLYALINGGAEVYINAGMIEGIEQKMSAPVSTGQVTYEGLVMDFGAGAKARAMMDLKRQSDISTPISIGAFPATAVVAELIRGGVTVLANFGNFYVEFSLLGFTEDQDAIDTAELFLKVYESRAE